MEFAHLGFAELKVHIGHLESWVFVHLGHEHGQYLSQFINVGSLQYILHGHTATAATEGGLLLNERAGCGLLLHCLRELGSCLHLRVVALADVGQGYLYVTRTARHTGCDELGIGHERVGQATDVLRVVAHILVGHTLGAHGPDGYLRAVFEWCHLGRYRAPHPYTADKGNDHHHERYGTVTKYKVERTLIEPVQSYEERLCLAVEPPLLLATLENLGGKHRGHGKRSE